MSKRDDLIDHHIMHPLEDSEAIVEKALFSVRLPILLLCLALTAFFAYQASQMKVAASFEKMIPANHPYIANFLEHKKDLSGLGNSLRIVVETTEGDIFDKAFQETLKQINDEVFFINGVDRSGLKSIWSPNVRWTEVTEEGFVGGTVIPKTYDGSEGSLQQLRDNVFKSGTVGSLVANNLKSAMILAPLYSVDPKTGQSIDYQQLSQDIERLVRDKYQHGNIQIHVTGFAKVVGDLIEGAVQVALFFVAAIGITLVLLYLYARCWRGTLIPLLCSIVAVIWQQGLLQSLGYGLDPYSMLVPFLVFAIAVSHGVQVVNAIALETGKGTDKVWAARKAFRALYIPGFIALFSDGLGFVTLMIIDIAVIQDLAIAASVGVATIVLTNLILLPILLSYSGVNGKNAHRDSQKQEQPWALLNQFTQPKPAATAVLVAIAAFALGSYYSQDLKIGDLDAGAPELRADSRYNQDNHFITSNYSTSTDVFVVMAKTADAQCVSYQPLADIERFQWHMESTSGVQSVVSMVDVAKRGIVGMNEGSLKWATLIPNQYVLNAATSGKHVPPGMINGACNLVPVVIYLDDHKAETLSAVVASAEQFIQQNPDMAVEFKLAAGSAGIEAATNMVIDSAQYEMLAWVYGVVSLLCFITFRSWRTVVCIIAPLALTSVLCQALMTALGIGVKVATLPVIALGVGIGVDYGIYIYTRLEEFLKQGLPLSDAYYQTLKSTGKAVAFTGLTLGIGVATWTLSPIKFQADMGILLTFMFVWNMLGALILLPALAHLLLKKSEPVKKPLLEAEYSAS
ncbi:efflux RND transporter permease subunit [Oceanospirillum beijerinckii]|uniref:efflux RND transporter permease subunit n=1 Tax=Oceanospirillum beijerinckii TaxID=64976 RepID=UPI000427B858|nr:MMPL family transporter [Oceanospirillum beijerinckii]